MVELVVVVVILGILAVFIVPRFADRGTFEQAGFHDQVLVALQHARKSAVASRRNVCVAADASGVTLSIDPQLPDGAPPVNCTLPLNLPGQSTNSIATPVGVSLTPVPANFTFDPLGRPSVAASLDVSGQTITVEPETGYVH